MKVKKYIAPTMPEAMQQVRKELGSDAVILNSKVIYTGGLLGLFKKKNIEVVAAVEPKPVTKQPQIKPTLKKKETTLKHDDKQQAIVLEELRSLRKWVEAKTSQDERPSFPAAFESLLELLVEQEVESEIAQTLIQETIEEAGSRDYTYLEAKILLKQKLKHLFSQYQVKSISFQKKFIHLVGPTGVGKTTTIAKLAAMSMLKDNKKVALITADTYRIAAIEQLKTYAKILDIPIEIAYTTEDYQKARLKFQQYDLVFVDTAGRNFRNPKYVAELGKVVDLEQDIETYLVLSMTTKASDVLAIFKQFQTIPLTSLILTKTDETASFGTVVNLAYRYQIGVAYLTNGQDVPDDIKQATPDLLAELVIGPQNNDES
ncbi:flagellar biosynthesis protein FlhF [Amphibacillus sediminis]|uniref:flagellar biosynthesis protein FlhF n=1 Tax=Amphibacillus sediminis TaxID=360185 RepID=UPI0008351B70|nr:flagellar biosynthesis protein FlhF [Amphibacillus sediminis]